MTTLNLSWNQLYHKTGTELATVLAGIPAGVTTLNLSWNYLYLKTGTELANIFAGIPVGVTTLDLSENELYQKTDTELTTAFARIPAGVTTLALDKSTLHDTNGVIRIALLDALPPSITHIIVDRILFRPEAYLLSTLLPIELRNDFYLEDFIYEPSFEIHEALLIKIVNYLQKHPSAIGYLVCALLLEERILNFFDDTFIHNNEYLSNRIIAAITFYRKAAAYSDQNTDISDFKSKIEHILWCRKIRLWTNTSPDIQNELQRFKLSPYDVNYHQYKQDTREGLLDIADNSDHNIDILSILRKSCASTEPIYSFWLKLKLFSVISLGAAAITLVCLNASFGVAAIGVILLSTLTYASCRFFTQVDQLDPNTTSSQLVVHL